MISSALPETLLAEPIATAAGTPAPKLDFRRRLPALDGVRGAAILLVFFYHYAGGAAGHTNSAAVRAVATLFGFGWSGVDLFFVLSGFLITGILFDTAGQEGYYKKFYARRALRIFPIYYLLVVIFLVLTPFLGVQWKPAHAFFLIYLGYPAALILPSLVSASKNVAITHLWSLSVEEQFYMIWPFLVAKLRKPQTILKACGVAVLLALLLRIAIRGLGVLDSAWAYAFLFCRLDALAIGAALAILARGEWREKVQKAAPVVFVVTAAAVVGICVLRRTVDHEDLLIATAGFTLIAVMYGALLTLALQAGSWFEAAFSAGVLRLFGKYSYGLYLYHFPLWVALAPLKEFFVSRLGSYFLGSTAHVFCCLGLNLVIAMASFHWFEAPIMRLKLRFNYA